MNGRNEYINETSQGTSNTKVPKYKKNLKTKQ